MGLYGKIIDLQKLGMAWDHVKKNKPACGVDSVSYEDFEGRRKEELAQLNVELVEHRYESLPVRLVNLYKGEKVRTIALFSMRDKVVQQSLATELGKIYEPLFSECTYAYRPGQSALTALNMIEERVQEPGDLWVLKMDISGFFDNIVHEILLRKLASKIREPDVIDLVKTVLVASALNEKTGDLTPNRRGVYQGASCAPILSNIYLMDFDAEMEKKCDFYIRYSDDILILTSDEAKARELYAFTQVFLEKEGLEIKAEKTALHRVTETDGFEYLGYAFSTRGKEIPQKAVDLLSGRLETLWLTSGLPIEEKLQKCQEILGGWEQYYRGEREPENMIEFAAILSMVRRKAAEVVEEVEEKRFALTNYYQDILQYMVEYWAETGRPEYALWEYEQFFQVGTQERPKEAENPNKKLMGELLGDYEKLAICPDADLYTDIIQLYTDLGNYKIASTFWEKKSEFESLHRELPTRVEATAPAGDPVANAKFQLSDYIALFVGREDTYVCEMPGQGGRRESKQVMEPLTEEKLQRHLDGQDILGTFVQRPNSTAKYLVFDVDISKKVLLENVYGSEGFARHKQKALEYALAIAKELRKMGIRPYIEDTGYRGYHVWIFFMEWIPVRYINQFTDVVRKKLDEAMAGRGASEEYSDISLEFFPNESRVREGKCGPKIKLPLGTHMKTGERSYFLDDDLQPVSDYQDMFSGIAKVSLTAVRKILGMNMEPEGKNHAGMNEKKEIELDMGKLGPISDSIKIVLEKCSLMRYLCNKAISTGYLSHLERTSILDVFGHIGDEGKEFVHTVMSFTMNYQYHITQKFINKIFDKPIGCIKLRERYKVITAEYGCSCSFNRTKDCYPSPVLHALKNSDENESQITVPTSRSLSKDKTAEAFEEINIHKQTQKLAKQIVELKRQRNGIDKSVKKIELQLQHIFDNAGVDCLEIDMGILVRRKKDDGYEWLIEI